MSEAPTSRRALIYSTAYIISYVSMHKMIASY